MLYDNGPLLALYIDAWRVNGNDYFRQVAEQTAEWVMREMQSPAGGYYATQDADSEGEEGKFYLWRPEEVKSALEPDEYPIVAAHFGLDLPANFEGHWHLKIARPVVQLAQEFNRTEASIAAIIERARSKLMTLRGFRPPVGRDEKQLAAWNGLMIKGMARAGRYLKRADILASAERALDFVQRELFRDGRLLASYKDGEARLAAYLDDHAFLLDGTLELLQTRWRSSDLRFAQQLADILEEHFEDEAHGGFYFTADDHEQLIHRPKPFMDESMPSGNGIAARALLRLGQLDGNLNYVDAARRCLSAGWEMMNDYPTALGAMLLALEEDLHGGQQLILRGQPKEMQNWLPISDTGYHPQRLSYMIPGDVLDLPEAIAARPVSGKVVAYLCSGAGCSAPITRVEDLKLALEN